MHSGSPENGIVSAGVSEIRAPITGSVWEVLAAAGETVRAEQVVAIIDSMKLEIPVEADRDATIRTVLVAPGDAVTEGQPMFELD